MARDINALHPRLKALALKLQEECAAHGLKIIITDCVRNEAEQLACVRNGSSSCYWPYSHHNWGTAFDFCRGDGTGAYRDNDGFFRKVGKIGESLGLEWGGSWTSPVDQPHFQLPDWGTGTSKLRQQYGTPDNFMRTWVQTTPAASKPFNAMVQTFQKWLNTTYTFPVDVDGYYGPQTKEATIKALQYQLNADYKAGLVIDGIFGTKTKAAIRGLEQGTKHTNQVHILQALLYAHDINMEQALDGHYGAGTAAAVKAFQKANGLTVDGIAGKATFAKLLA